MKSHQQNEDVLLEAFIRACKYRPLEEVKQIIAQGVNPRFNGDLALCLAAWRGVLPLLQFLVEQKDLNVNAWNGEPLCNAAGEGHLPAVEYLLDKGADIGAQGHKALRWAVWRGRSQVVKSLISSGADPKTLVAGDLIIVCSAGHLEMVRFLVETCKVDLTYQKYAALRHALLEKRDDVFQYLIKNAGVDLPAARRIWGE